MSTVAIKPIMREGRFLFSVVEEPEIAEYESGAEAIRIGLLATREWCAEVSGWKDLDKTEGIRAEFFITKKSGDAIQNTVEMLFESIGLNIKDPAVCGADFIGRLCQGDIRADLYGGTTRFKVTRIHLENAPYRPAKLRRLGASR